MRHRPEYSNLTCGPQQWLLQLHESSPRCRKNVIRIAANRSELRTKNKKRRRKRLAPFHHDLLVSHGKFVLTDDRSMIDWGAFGAPRRVDCDDLYGQPQTALEHRRISLCVRPAVREEEVAMVR